MLAEAVADGAIVSAVAENAVVQESGNDESKLKVRGAQAAESWFVTATV